jgi:hypothetical protein
MRLELDHFAVAAETLEAGVAHVEAALGVPLQPGGRHALMGTHNQLLGLGPGVYLEVIAVDPAAPRPPHPRWFDLDRFSGNPRPTNWIVRTDDLAGAVAALPPGMGRPTDLERGDLRWRMAIPETGVLPFDDACPALIEWHGTLHPADRLEDRGCRLVALEISHPEAGALAAALPIADARLTFAVGRRALRAVLDTPNGRRVLE